MSRTVRPWVAKILAISATALIPLTVFSGTASAASDHAASVRPRPAQARTVRPAARGQARPDAYWPLAPGEALLVNYNSSPLRTCAANGCSVIVYMPKSQGVWPGGGYVTSVIEQNYYNPYCEVNYKGTIGWAGCWRLALPG